MLSKLKDYITALPKNAIKPLGKGIQRCLYNTTVYTYGPKSCFSTNSLSCATFVMYVLYQWITEKSMLDDINDRFLLVNDIGISFEMLSLVKSIDKKINWTILPVDSTKQGSKA